MSEYVKGCNRCGQKIKMSDELGKWKAFDLEGKKIHECKPKQQENKQETIGHNDISLELVLAKLRKIGVDINLDLLKNVPVNGDAK
jgi:hypothetical protein